MDFFFISWHIFSRKCFSASFSNASRLFIKRPDVFFICRSSHYFFQCRKQPSQASPMRNTLIHRATVWNLMHSPSFTKLHFPVDVKLGESSVKPEASHEATVFQALMHRWSLWSLFSTVILVLRQFRGNIHCYFQWKSPLVSFRRPKGGRISVASTLCSRESSLTLWMTKCFSDFDAPKLTQNPFTNSIHSNYH